MKETHKSAIAICLLFLFDINVFAQKVENPKYATLLNTLLSHSVPEVSVDDVKYSSAVFIDAREKNEFDVSHIKSARWVGYDNFRLSRIPKMSKSDSIIVYCSVGYRSEKVAEKLRKKGYQNVFNLYGGLFEWVNREQPVVNKNGVLTQNIHPYDKTWGLWLEHGVKAYDFKD